MLHSKQTILTILKAQFLSNKEKPLPMLIAQKLCVWEEIESTHARVYTTYDIQQHVKNRRSTPRMGDGAEEIGNLNSSIHGKGRNLNVLCHWRVNWVCIKPKLFQSPGFESQIRLLHHCLCF